MPINVPDPRLASAVAVWPDAVPVGVVTGGVLLVVGGVVVLDEGRGGVETLVGGGVALVVEVGGRVVVEDAWVGVGDGVELGTEVVGG